MEGHAGPARLNCPGPFNPADLQRFSRQHEPVGGEDRAARLTPLIRTELIVRLRRLVV